MIPLDFHWYPNPATGYGKMGDQMADALRRFGVTFTTEADTRVWASNINGIAGHFSHQRLVPWTMWETDRLPDAYHGILDPADLVLVPCEMNREVFSQHHANVEVMPLGIADCVTKPRPDEGPMVFLAGGRGWERKGIDAALEAFCDVADDDCEFWIRAEGRVPDHPLLADPRVKLIERVDSFPELLSRVHVFIAASRGEGYGLMPLEAMAQGCPTILTDGHGHAEFSKYGTRVSTSKVRANMVGLGDPGCWWEPDPEDLRGAIGYHIEAYDSLQSLAVHFAEKVRTEFAWQPARLMKLLGEVGIGVHGVFVPFEAPHVHEIRVTRRVRAQIGPHQVTMVPDETYLHTWDVKRVIRDSGALDPGCWDFDSVDGVLV